jgi:hypothetical protein
LFVHNSRGWLRFFSETLVAADLDIQWMASADWERCAFARLDEGNAAEDFSGAIGNEKQDYRNHPPNRLKPVRPCTLQNISLTPEEWKPLGGPEFIKKGRLFRAINHLDGRHIPFVIMQER